MEIKTQILYWVCRNHGWFFVKNLWQNGACEQDRWLQRPVHTLYPWKLNNHPAIGLSREISAGVNSKPPSYAVKNLRWAPLVSTREKLVRFLQSVIRQEPPEWINHAHVNTRAVNTCIAIWLGLWTFSNSARIFALMMATRAREGSRWAPPLASAAKSTNQYLSSGKTNETQTLFRVRYKPNTIIENTTERIWVIAASDGGERNLQFRKDSYMGITNSVLAIHFMLELFIAV